MGDLPLEARAKLLAALRDPPALDTSRAPTAVPWEVASSAALSELECVDKRELGELEQLRDPTSKKNPVPPKLFAVLAAAAAAMGRNDKDWGALQKWVINMGLLIWLPRCGRASEV